VRQDLQELASSSHKAHAASLGFTELEDTGRKRGTKSSYWMKASLPAQLNHLWLNYRFMQKFTPTTQLECRSVLKR